MQITVDGHENPVDTDPSDTLADTLESIDEQVQSNGYRVQSFELDGEEAWPEWKKQIGDEPINEFDKLDVQLVSPREMSRETLDELQPQFDELLKFTDETIEKLGRGEKKDGFKHLQAVMSHLHQYIDTINHILLLSEIDLDGVTVNDTSVEDLAHQLRRIINDVEEIIKDEQLEELSTLAGNRLKPLLQNLSDACPIIIERVENSWPEPEPLD